MRLIERNSVCSLTRQARPLIARPPPSRNRGCPEVSGGAAKYAQARRPMKYTSLADGRTLGSGHLCFASVDKCTARLFRSDGRKLY